MGWKTSLTVNVAYLLLLAAASPLALSQTAPESNGPSLDETSQWIVQAMQRAGHSFAYNTKGEIPNVYLSHRDADRYGSISFRGCTVSWTHQRDWLQAGHYLNVQDNTWHIIDNAVSGHPESSSEEAIVHTTTDNIVVNLADKTPDVLALRGMDEYVPQGAHVTGNTTKFFVSLLPTVGKINNEPSFIFEDEDFAHRVAKALGHAIGLCGGKPRTPERPEPF